MRVGRAGRIGALLAGAIVLVLVLAQIFLPGIAASRIRSRVGRYGTVRSVAVTAWPAVELLWGKADSVDVRAGSLSLNPAQTVELLGEARGVKRMNLTAESLKEGPLQLHEASFSKHGDALLGQAQTSRADVGKALGEGIEVRLQSSHDGQVQVSASGGLFGVQASMQRGRPCTGRQAGRAPVGLSAGRAEADPDRQSTRVCRRRRCECRGGAVRRSGGLQAVDLGEPALSCAGGRSSAGRSSG